MLKLSLLQKFKYPTPTAQQENRLRPRHIIKVRVRYRTREMPGFKEALLYELSQSGLLLALPSAIPVKTRIHLVIMPNDDSQHPVHIMARVVRRADEITDSENVYGCEIEEYHDTN